MSNKKKLIITIISSAGFCTTLVAQANYSLHRLPAGTTKKDSASVMKYVEKTPGYLPPAGTVTQDSVTILKDAHEMTVQMGEQLSLTTDQLVKVGAINTIYEEHLFKTTTLKDVGKPAGTIEVSYAKKIENNHLESLKDVLSPQQMSRYKQLRNISN